MKSLRAFGYAGVLFLQGLAMPALAQNDVELLPKELLTPTTEKMTPAGAYRKEAPWTIGMSMGGVGNTWIVQMHQELMHEAGRNPKIKELRFVEANWQPAKQVADIEDLLASGVDALIIAPISTSLVASQVQKAAKMGIPVITYSATDGALGSTVELKAGGEAFGRVGGEFLKEKLGGKGVIWVFRGVAGVEEETERYNGFKKALAGSNITIGTEVFGDWNYAKSKQLCENLVLSGKPVDGIWFSGAEMTRACIDVFKETGTRMVPMTGEGNNGFLRIWDKEKIDSVAAVFTPAMGAAFVRATVALLEGKPLYKAYISAPAPITNETLEQYYRKDLNDSYWVPSSLPEDVLKSSFGRK